MRLFAECGGASETSNNSPMLTHHLAWFQCPPRSLDWAKSLSPFEERRHTQSHSKGPPESCRETITRRSVDNWFRKAGWHWWLSAPTLLTVQCVHVILTWLQCWQSHWHLGPLPLTLASLQQILSCLLKFWGSEAAAQSSTCTPSQPFQE